MDTKKVEDLLQQIRTAEAKVAELEKAVQEAQQRLTAQQRLVFELKQELAQELRDVLDVAGAAVKREGKPKAARGRVRGLSSAILDILEDGQVRTAKEIATLLSQKGVTAGNLSVTLSMLAKHGRIERTGRGHYRLAGKPAAPPS